MLYRLPPLFAGFACLAAGVGAGLARLGWDLPPLFSNLLILHGPLMVAGFFGILISLERAVALDARWAYMGPIFGALGGVALIAGAPPTVGILLLIMASLIFAAASAVIVYCQREVFTVTLFLGAASWFIGNLIWLSGAPFLYIIPWWMGFLVLTIAGERLELSRFLPPSQVAQGMFIIIIATLLVGMTASLMATAAYSIFAAALVMLALWLARYDIARRTIKGKGLTRFIAVCLLTGYVWLGIGGLIGLAVGDSLTGLAYDAILHAVFLGFVFSMVFGHAPIIFPAVTGFSVFYHPIFYAHLALLHFSLILRLLGDFSSVIDWRAIGGLLNAFALGLFVLNTLIGIICGRYLKTKVATA